MINSMMGTQYKSSDMMLMDILHKKIFHDYASFMKEPQGNCAYMLDITGNKHYFLALTNSAINGGIKNEGEAFFLHLTPEEAVQAYQDNLEKMCNTYSGLYLYWRQLPSLERFPNGYAVYSRLLFLHEELQNPTKELTKPQETMPANLGQAGIRYLEPGWRCSNKGPNPKNKSGFRATGHRILLIPDAVEEKSAGGIVLARKTVIAEENIAVVATVLEIGPDAWSDKSTDYCKVGDRVLIGQYVGKFHESPVDGKKYRFVSDLDIISPIVEPV